MNLKEIEYIVTLAEEGKLARAAQRLFITPSALTQQVSNLEHEIQLAGTDNLLLGAYIGLVDIDGHFRKLFVEGRINMGEGCGSMFGSNTNT